MSVLSVLNDLNGSIATKHQHVDWPGEDSVTSGYRIANPSDGAIVFEKFYGKRIEWTGELKLLLAVLDQAIHDLQNAQANAKARTDRRCAARWAMGGDGGQVVSFVYVCEALGLDPGYVRDGMRNRWPAAFVKL